MFNQDESIWFNQTIQTYKDKIYNTNGYLRVSILTNSNDNQNFNPPKLNISIKNNYSKNLSLSGENALELAVALGNMINSFNGEKIEIVKKFKADLQFIIEMFQLEEKNLVKLTLLSNSSDFTVIVIPHFPTFILFGRIIKEFSNNYFNICEKMFLKTMDSMHRETILQLPSLIKGISTSTVPFVESYDTDIDKEDIEKTEITINDFDEFIGGSDMKNVSIPEIDNHIIDKKEEKVSFTDVDSKFVSNILKDDLSTLENMISGLSVSHKPIEDFKNRLIEDGEYSDSFDPLFGINEDDLKSLCYITRLTFLLYQKNYIENGVLIPDSFSPVKFNSNDYSDENINLAYDLLLFNGYIKLLRNRLEMKIPNATENKSIFHLAFRCFMDPFIFSFIPSIEKESLVSIIMNRFKCYDSRGVFDKYKTSCNTFNVSEINEQDIHNFISNLSDMILSGKIPTIDHIHKNGYETKNLRLSTQNDFNLEQIINEVIPLEVGIKLNNNEITDELINKINNKENLSDDVINFFKTKVKIEKVKEEKESTTLKKMIEKFKEQVPEDFKDDFYKLIDELSISKKDFNFDENKFPWEKFGDDIIKILYLWKPEQDKKIAENLSYFSGQYGDCIHTRSTILAKEINTNSDDSDDLENDEFDMDML